MMEGNLLISPRARRNVLLCPDPDYGGVGQGAGGVKDKVGRQRVPRELGHLHPTSSVHDDVDCLGGQIVLCQDAKVHLVFHLVEGIYQVNILYLTN